MNVERDTKGRLIRPNFVSDVPRHLLRGKTDADIWLYEKLSVSGQQNEWLIATTMDSDQRHHRSENDLRELKTLRLIISSKWSMLFSLAVLVLIPAAMVGFLVWCEKYFGKP